MAGQIIRKPHAWAEVFVVVARLLSHQRRRQRTERGSCLEFLEGPAVGDIGSTDEIVILVPTKPKVHSQAAAHFPVILEVQSELLRILDDEVGIANRDAHRVYSAWSCKAIWVISGRAAPGRCRIWRHAEDAAWVINEVDLEGRIELEKAAHERRVDVIESSAEGVLADCFAQVVLELPLALDGLLRNVGVGAELRAGKGDERGPRLTVNQVVPILPPDSELVEQPRRERRVQGEVGNLQVVLGEVAFR